REALTGRRVERVHARRVRGDRDDVTGRGVVAAVHTDHDLGVVAVDHGGTVQVTVRTELLNEVHLDLEAALGRRNDREVLGAHAHGDGVTRRALNVMRNRNNSRTDLNAVTRDLRGEQVHRGRTDEAGDEVVLRRLVEVARRTDLLKDAVLQNRDAVAHGEGLG